MAESATRRQLVLTFLKPVTNATHGHDAFWIAYFAGNRLDMEIHPAIQGIRPLPHRRVHQLPPREDMSGSLEKDLQDAEFRQGQRYFLPVIERSVSLAVNPQAKVFHHVGCL